MPHRAGRTVALNMTRQPKTLHDSEVQMPRTMSGPCGTNGQVGKSWRCRFSTAQCDACGVCCGTTLGSSCHMFVFDLCRDIKNAGMVTGRANRMQCGEAVVPVSWPVEQVVLVFLLRTEKMVKTNFVVVSATLLGTQDPRQAFESVSEEGPYTFLEILGHCVALPVFIRCSHRPNHFATTF